MHTTLFYNLQCMDINIDKTYSIADMELHCNIMFNVLCTPDILSVVALCHLLLLLCKEVMIFTSGDAHVRTLYAITQHLLTCYGRDKSKCWSSISIHIYICYHSRGSAGKFELCGAKYREKASVYRNMPEVL